MNQIILSLYERLCSGIVLHKTTNSKTLWTMENKNSNIYKLQQQGRVEPLVYFPKEI